jgi:1-acyl-sn-glycerol-3-phosphate acyltransferase
MTTTATDRALEREFAATTFRRAVLRRLHELAAAPAASEPTASAPTFAIQETPAAGPGEKRPHKVSPAGVVRSLLRSMGFLTFITATIALQCIAVVLSPRARTRRARAEWLQRTARGCAWLLGLRIDAPAALPSSGLLVANHLSYLDIIVLASLRPCVFVSKAEVSRWPIFGICARLGGTLFVDRTRRGAVAEISEQMRGPLADGLLLVLFPEGTSSGGDSVLPFKSSLLEPALRLGCSVTPAALGYRLSGGSVPDEICYWRDMTLLPHLLNVFSKRRVEATLRCGLPRPRCGDRKAVAHALHTEVRAFHAAIDAESGREFGVRPPQAVEQFIPVARARFPATAEPQHA